MEFSRNLKVIFISAVAGVVAGGITYLDHPPATSQRNYKSLNAEDAHALQIDEAGKSALVASIVAFGLLGAGLRRKDSGANNDSVKQPSGPSPDKT
jgi:hypothetical protein